MWFYLALLAAFGSAIATIARRTHGSTARPVELAWCTQVLIVLCSAALVIVSGTPNWSSHDFILPALASAALNCYAAVLFFDAYKYGQASVVSPLANLLPIGLLVTSFIMFGSVPAVSGLLGISLIVGGLYYSSVSSRHRLTQPIRKAWHQRGSRAMLACIVLLSVSTNLDKLAVRSASPAFVVLFVQAISLVLLSMYLLIQPSQRAGRVWRRWWQHIVIIAVFTALTAYFQTKAIALASSSYVLAVKRLDVLLIILFSGFVLGERHLLKRFEGSAIALIGVVIIYLFH